MKRWNDDGKRCDTCAFANHCAEWRELCGDRGADLFKDHYDCYVHIGDLFAMVAFMERIREER